jgi:hypothetical protein
LQVIRAKVNKKIVKNNSTKVNTLDNSSLFYTSASCCIETSLFVVPTSAHNATLSTVNTVTQHAHGQEAAHPNGAQSSRSTQKIGRGKVKNNI